MTESSSRKRPRTSPDPTEVPSWFVFPPRCFKVQDGQNVLYRTERCKGQRYRQGRILQVNESGKIHIQDSISKEKLIVDVSDQNGLFIPNFRIESTQTIVVTPETKEFRYLVGLITPDDRILEIGCSSGEASVLMLPKCQSWVGFDTSTKMLEKCKTALQALPSIETTKEYHAVIMNALVDSPNARREACRFGSPTVVALDIGGNRELINVLRMVSWVTKEFHPNLIMIKSRELTAAIHSSSSSSPSSLTIDDGTGLITDGHDWFQRNRPNHAMPKHPKKAPLVMSPKDPNKPICRYHNYHKNGCQKDDCTFDHEHCHFCLEPGHVAKHCPLLCVADE